MFAQAWQTKSFKTGPFQNRPAKTPRDTFRSNGTIWNRTRLCSAFPQRTFQSPAAPVSRAAGLLFDIAWNRVAVSHGRYPHDDEFLKPQSEHMTGADVSKNILAETADAENLRRHLEVIAR